VSKPNVSADYVSNCKTLSKKVNLSNPENLKTLLIIAQITPFSLKTDSVSNGENESKPNLPADSVSNC